MADMPKPSYTTAAEALEKLNALLPLAARQAALPEPLRRLHRAILQALVESNRPLRLERMAQEAGVDDLDGGIARLMSDDLVVVDDEGAVVGAYPMIRELRDHLVLAGMNDVHAMCAVDALAISLMFGQPAIVRSRCAVTGNPVTINQNGEQVTPFGVCGDLHVGIQWQATDSCAAKTLCLDMIYLCSAEVAANWQAGHPESRSVLSLDGAVALARDFFMPLVG